MKKIGILFGQENSFPDALIEKINQKKANGVTAESVILDKVMQGHSSGYDVIIDRISHNVPFFRAFLKNEACVGTAVINNPFWQTADDRFFNNTLAMRLGIAVPRTCIIPSKHRPDNTNEYSFRNLSYPFNWQTIFEYVGFPAYLKPFSGGGRKTVHRINNPEEFFRIYDETGQVVMMLQEEISYTDYFRSYCIDCKEVRIMQYDPQRQYESCYIKGRQKKSRNLLNAIQTAVTALNRELGYDINEVEIALKDGVPYAIDICNPVPDSDPLSVGEENFEWMVENTAALAIKRAKAQKPGDFNCTWGKFVSDANNT